MADRQAERDEDDQLGQGCQRAVKALQLVLERQARAADDESCHEDGEEARAVRQGGDPVESSSEGERQYRVKALAQAARHAGAGAKTNKPPARPVAEPIPISTANSRRTTEQRGIVVGRKLDHPDHQGHARRVVHACLPSSVGPERALISLAEDGEHDCGVRRGERGPRHASEDPSESERVMGEGRDEAGRREGPEESGRQDRAGGPETAPADIDPSVEEDHDERDHGQPLDSDNRDQLVRLVQRSETSAAATRKTGRSGDAIRVVIFVERTASAKPPVTREDDGSEVDDLGHGAKSRTRVPAQANAKRGMR